MQAPSYSPKIPATPIYTSRNKDASEDFFGCITIPFFRKIKQEKNVKATFIYTWYEVYIYILYILVYLSWYRDFAPGLVLLKLDPRCCQLFQACRTLQPRCPLRRLSSFPFRMNLRSPDKRSNTCGLGLNIA